MSKKLSFVISIALIPVGILGMHPSALVRAGNVALGNATAPLLLAAGNQLSAVKGAIGTGKKGTGKKATEVVNSIKVEEEMSAIKQIVDPIVPIQSTVPTAGPVVEVTARQTTWVEKGAITQSTTSSVKENVAPREEAANPVVVNPAIAPNVEAAPETVNVNSVEAPAVEITKDKATAPNAEAASKTVNVNSVEAPAVETTKDKATAPNAEAASKTVNVNSVEAPAVETTNDKATAPNAEAASKTVNVNSVEAPAVEITNDKATASNVEVTPKTVDVNPGEVTASKETVQKEGYFATFTSAFKTLDNKVASFLEARLKDESAKKSGESMSAKAKNIAPREWVRNCLNRTVKPVKAAEASETVKTEDAAKVAQTETPVVPTSSPEVTEQVATGQTVASEASVNNESAKTVGKSMREKARNVVGAPMEWVRARLNRTVKPAAKTAETSEDAAKVAQAEIPVVPTSSKISRWHSLFYGNGAAKTIAPEVLEQVATAQTVAPEASVNEKAPKSYFGKVFEKGKAFAKSPKQLAIAAGIVGASAYAYKYFMNSEEDIVKLASDTVTEEVKQSENVSLSLLSNYNRFSRKNVVIATVATALVAAASYALLQVYSKPSFEALAQQYVYETEEQVPAVIIEQFCQALEKHGYTSVADKQKAMQIFIEAGLVQE